MKIVPPSYEILDRRFMSVEEKIEAAGRVAYKSEDKISHGTAAPFCRKIIGSGNYPEDGHFPVIEFANLHIRVLYAQHNDYIRFMANINTKYLAITLQNRNLYISGTVRAFREALNASSGIAENIAHFLFEEYPLFFENFSAYSNTTGRTIHLLDTESVIREVNDVDVNKHLMCSVKFIHNRAFTHELVRMRPCSFLQESQRYCRYSNEKFGKEVTFIDPGVFYPIGSSEREIWESSMRAAESSYMALLETSTPQAARTVLPNSCKTEIIVFTTLAEWKHIFYLRTSPAAEPSMREVMTPLRDEFWNRTECFE